MIDSHTALVGTPEEVIEQVQFNRDLIGEHEPSMQINFGGIKDREAFRTLELFAARVMPHFQTPAAPEPQPNTKNIHAKAQRPRSRRRNKNLASESRDAE